ncbi:MAG TPA: TIGR03066 family protein, partial [Urbifossiella sp.]|nr:TIGR03066 family protein [Urbifossiella sp.]
MRVILAGLAATVLMVAAGGVAVGRDEKVDAKLLVGKWTPEDADKKGKMFVEFAKDGKVSFAFSFEKDGVKKEFKFDGTYKLDS